MVRFVIAAFALSMLLLFGCASFEVKREAPNNLNSSDLSACNSDAECVPEAACHPSNCVHSNVINKSSRGGLICTLECKPGTLDCGYGECKCISGQCSAVFN